MTSTTKARKLGDLVRASKDARPPDQTGWGSETPSAAAAEPAARPDPAAADRPEPAAAAAKPAEASGPRKAAAAKREAAKSAASAEAAPSAPPVTDGLPAYLQLERVQTRVDPEVMTAIRTAEVRLKAARRPAAVAGERLNTNTLIRAALQAVADSGALQTCSGASEAELVESIRRHLQSWSN